jgi:hypothetical protein
MARYNHVIAQPETMSILVQRLTDGERLREIAKAWEIPYGRLAAWIAENPERKSAYEAALSIWADSLAQEAVAIADEQAEVVKENGETYDPNVQRDKLRIDTRLKLASRWNRDRYGETVKHQHTGLPPSLTIVLAGEPEGRVIEHETPVALPAPAEEGVI